MSFPREPQLVAGHYSEDSRGVFSKPYSGDSDNAFEIKEIFWTVSSRGTIRGMHFQLEPAEIGKLVWVSHGTIHDVLIDLREGAGFGKVSEFTLDSNSTHALYVPAGFAHGFQSLADNSIVNYAVDGLFSAEHDTGVRWDSFGYDWPLPPTEISGKDRGLPLLANFGTPFTVAR